MDEREQWVGQGSHRAVDADDGEWRHIEAVNDCDSAERKQEEGEGEDGLRCLGGRERENEWNTERKRRRGTTSEEALSGRQQSPSSAN